MKKWSGYDQHVREFVCALIRDIYIGGLERAMDNCVRIGAVALKERQRDQLELAHDVLCVLLEREHDDLAMASWHKATEDQREGLIEFLLVQARDVLRAWDGMYTYLNLPTRSALLLERANAFMSACEFLGYPIDKVVRGRAPLQEDARRDGALRDGR